MTDPSNTDTPKPSHDSSAESPHPKDAGTLGLGTLAVHGGQAPEPITGAIMPPIFQTSTYVQPALGQDTGFDYARVRNPTREALERNIASLEGGVRGAAFSSGLSAIETLIKTLSAGDHILCEENVYGGVFRMATRVLERLGLEFSWIDTRDPDRVRAAVRDNTRLIHVETPTNPMMRITDIRAMAKIAKDAGARLSIDNTFATPVNQRPLELGADIVVHSTTKYLNGHSDIIGGVTATKDEALDEELKFIRKSTGCVPGPMDAWLCLRGTKTLQLRMERHNRNGMAIARFLESHPSVRTVHYPGLESHPQHAVASSQMTGFTGMISVDVGSLDAARKLVEGTRIFQLAESLGGVESLISVPALMTHASVPEAERERMGVTDALVRLSVGIEDEADLIEDLRRALD